MGALGVVAAVALLIGGVQTTMVMTESDRIAAEQDQTPVVEVQTLSESTTESALTSELIFGS
ncbi:hypothetical protein CKO25_06980 [Thiocapsa imhoffii]|uniref:Uncharacterized protein n=1 Tax=Thiocapsa imhoffii TaxID=382777 RepID=A0A9X1B8M2_9GAMM|nr:hypothetical protein [Thiocapsa imhoffii]MBK1644403.1 hypothetical protein [Thiocapsa imhoffii]